MRIIISDCFQFLERTNTKPDLRAKANPPPSLKALLVMYVVENRARAQNVDVGIMRNQIMVCFKFS